eukprot:CAMPEP_0177760776 /NCGR_PEP_ID=MMETSP0491_2-20121128/5450_1 /TAXON_ID=63592 /ORGANISM="Tetraselmis chuii, Strain PLY429" /LENGTH=244 /DNA_ID=CAMNT_0019276703 /DNA_START=129 /DNA_END=864 /DNA_ORIENTATION=-
MANFNKDVADVLSKYTASQVSGSPEKKPSRTGPSIGWSDSEESEGEVRSRPPVQPSAPSGDAGPSASATRAAPREPSLSREDFSVSSSIREEQSFSRMAEPRAPPQPVSPPAFQPAPVVPVQPPPRQPQQQQQFSESSESHNTRRRHSEVTSSTRTKEETRYEFHLPLDRVRAHQVELSPEFAFSRESEHSQSHQYSTSNHQSRSQQQRAAEEARVAARAIPSSSRSPGGQPPHVPEPEPEPTV